MADNSSLGDYFEERMIEKIREPNLKLLEEFKKDEKRRALSRRQANKADKLLIKEKRAEQKAKRGADKKPGGLTGRLASRAGGAGLGLISDFIGSIPIAGAIFKAFGEELSDTMKAQADYNERLKEKRLEELELLEEANSHREMNYDSPELIEYDPEPEGKSVDPIIYSPEVTRVDDYHNLDDSEDADFDEIEVSKINDTEVLEYLHGIEFYGQETAVKVEDLVESLGLESRKRDRINKAIRYNANSQLVKLSSLDELATEAKQADEDLLEQAMNQTKLQEKSLRVQEDTRLGQIISAITNLMSGGGLIGTLGKLASGLGKAAVVTISVAAAWEIGQAIGDKLYNWLSEQQWFVSIADTISRAIDRILAFFGNEEAELRLKTYEDGELHKKATDITRKAFNRDMTLEEEKYLRDHGTLPGIERRDFDPKRYELFTKSDSEIIEQFFNQNMEGPADPLDGDILAKITRQIMVEKGVDIRHKPEPKPNIINTQTNQNSNTVIQPPLSSTGTNYPRNYSR